jgi:hypothetical protein
MATVEFDIVAFIAAQPAMMDLLRAVEALNLSDGWVGAGFVRNPVWDALHGFPWSPSYSDVDVVYFDDADADPERDRRIDHQLRTAMPGIPWSVKNQARMHRQNHDHPYADTADAMTHWPETCTAIGVRTKGTQVELLAPFGTSDLLSLVVRPTPAFASKRSIYQSRLAEKRWVERWPRLRYLPDPAPIDFSQLRAISHP